LGADDDQIDFPVIYASAREGVASLDPDEALAQVRAGNGGSILPLLDGILKHVPPPAPSLPAEAPEGEEPRLQLMVTMLDHDDYVGRIAIGRIQAGSLKTGQPVCYGKPDLGAKKGRVQAL